MLSALALSGPVAPVVPSPPCTTDTAQPAQRESFNDVYKNVPTDDQSRNDAGSRPKTASSTDVKNKKGSTSDGNEKVAATATPSPHGFVLQRAPLVFALQSLGPEVPLQPKTDGSENSAEDQSQAQAQSSPQTPVHPGANDSTSVGVPNFNLPLAAPGQVAASSLAPANEKIAFSAHLTPSDPATTQAPAPRASLPQPSRTHTSSEATRNSDEPTPASAAKDEYQTADIKKDVAPEAVLPVREITNASALDLRQTPSQPQHVEQAPPSSTHSLAIQEAQPVLPETPKPPASTEILLQVAGQDQSTASVRVVDRSGTVNVTVHAADADLRSSLRSNLSDLASQLTGQGYKTEIIKPAMIAANANNQHDSRQGGRDGSGQQQQHFTPDGRQSQRDRRANSERWRDEFEQETSGAPGAPGGKR